MTDPYITTLNAMLDKRDAEIEQLTDHRDALQSQVKGACDTIERLRTALRRIKSLEEKNVPKYAQQIASEALTPDK